MPKIISEVDRGARVVAGVDVRTVELVWNDAGRSYEVHRVDTGEDLTVDGCFDDPPTDEQIEALLRQHIRQDERAGRADLGADQVGDCEPLDGAGTVRSAQ